nr:bifunctional metallophosphatase/5'-nucleotidase [uncultured Roseateles sp.]
MKFHSGLAALALAVLSACSTQAPPPAVPVKVKLLAINDFHGNLKPPPGGITVQDPDHPDKTLTVAAGGAEHMATALRGLMARNPNHIFVAAGDLVGASPLLSALFADEPTVEAMGLMGLEASAVGNHEFDAGLAELLRKQAGGCHPERGCKGPTEFKGARYQYLAASTWDERSGKTIFPAYYVKSFEGIPVAFIGLTLKGTPDIVIPTSVAHLRFEDEADTVNRLVPELRAKGIEAIVVLIHEGGFPAGDYNECPGISGPIVDIVKRLDRAVDLVISGHTHRAYNCRIDGRLVTSGDKFGTIVTDIDVELDPRTRDVIAARANNVLVRTDRFAKDAGLTRLIDGYEQLVGPMIQRPVGRIAESLSREEGETGATPMGQLIADAQLAATAAPEAGGAVIAITNIGGVRTGLTKTGDGTVSYGDAYATQPFQNNLVTVTLTGAQIRLALEQQWLNQPKFRPLQLSEGLRYSWAAKAPAGAHVVEGSLQLHGRPLEPNTGYRVTFSNFMFIGGDGFKVFAQGTAPRIGPSDIDALVQYLQSRPLTTAPPMDRVRRIN